MQNTEEDKTLVGSNADGAAEERTNAVCSDNVYGASVTGQCSVSADSPLVSVVIPVHNASATLEKCVAGLTGQTYGRLEILLAENASTDGSAELCRAIAARDGRVRVLTTETASVSAARNAALDAMRGEYFVFVDADDLVEPQMLETLLAEAGGADMVMSYMDRVPLGGGLRTGREYEPTDVKFGLEDVLGDTKTGGGMLGTLFRASVYGGLRFNEALRFNEDVLYMFGCAALGGRVRSNGMRVYHYMIPSVPYSVKYYNSDYIPGLIRFTEKARELFTAAGKGDEFAAYAFYYYCGAVRAAARCEKKLTPETRSLLRSFASVANTKEGYKAYLRTSLCRTKGIKARVEAWLIRRRLNALYRFIVRRTKL